MIRKLKKKWKFLGLILLSACINVYLYLRVPKNNTSSPKAENATAGPSWKEIYWMKKFKRLEDLYMSQREQFIGPDNTPGAKAENITAGPPWIADVYWMQEFKRLEALTNRTLVGPGANGIGIKVDVQNLSLEDKKKIDLGQKKHGFNTFVSDIVSHHRKLPDLRYPACRHLIYPSNLPPASIIIIFRDELLSILLRTIYSIVENTPDYLIQEIILVDDGSTLSDLFATLEIHVFSLPKVSIVRLKTSQGLMVARQTGIERARSEYFVVMDSHMEVVTGWLEPLIHRLVEQPKALLCSKIGAIDKEDLRVSFGDGGKTKFIGFNFHLDEQWNKYDNSYLQKHRNLTQPLDTAMVQGMFIAMRKDFFLQLGGFDTGMQIWGTEQMELSIKVWTCGGTVEIIPCSMAAHLYRHTPWAKNGTARARNRLRVTDVWLDDYKNGIFHMHKHRMVDYGDVEDRKKIREKNECKPFSYLLQKIREFTSEFYIPLRPKAKGRIRNIFRKNYCLDPDKTPHKPILYRCHFQFNQYFVLTETSDIRVDGHFCLVPSPSSDNLLILDNCSNVPAKFKAVRRWTYEKDKTIRNRGKCLTADSNKDLVNLQPCRAGPTQQWIWEW